MDDILINYTQFLMRTLNGCLGWYLACPNWWICFCPPESCIKSSPCWGFCSLSLSLSLSLFLSLPLSISVHLVVLFDNNVWWFTHCLDFVISISFCMAPFWEIMNQTDFSYWPGMYAYIVHYIWSTMLSMKQIKVDGYGYGNLIS